MSDEKPVWHYLLHNRGQTVRDPIQGEFFSTEAIEDAAEALICEGIQIRLMPEDGGRMAHTNRCECVSGFPQGIPPQAQSQSSG